MFKKPYTAQQLLDKLKETFRTRIKETYLLL